jgi:hypothetical protein
MIARFRISEKDYVSALKLYGKLTPKMMVIYLLVAGALALVAIFGASLLRSGAIGSLIGGGIVVIFGRYVITPILARRHYRKYKAIHGEFAISLSNDGVRIESSNAKGFLLWSEILKWRENDEFLLLYLMPRLYQIVPKSLSQEGFDIDLLVKGLNKNVGKAA